MAEKHIFKKQNGNVLFLILIAVVLFGALAYSVTQSSRGGGNVDKEKQKIALAKMEQFEARLKFEYMRMQTTKGVSPDDISFAADSEDIAEIEAILGGS